MLELELNWPQNVTILELRNWIISHLNSYGSPLRWAITDVKSSKGTAFNRQIKVEAVLLIN